MTLNDLENAVAGLSSDELAKFRAWFAEFDALEWDRQFEEDVVAGKLDSLAEEALREHRAGKTREL
jgi:hypothetical protein